MAVLETKIHAPVVRRDLVSRRRLTDTLTEHQSPRLVLVAAPAGFGKTTLLAQWLAASPDPGARVSWLSLDVGDNDPRRFFQHLLASLGALGDFSEAADLLAAASHVPPAQLPVDAILTSVVNDLDRRAGSTVIALDDYHLINDAQVHAAVTFLLENLPPGSRLAIATRADPPLPLARLRARGELAEVRAADLRFTADESSTFLAEVMGLDLTEPQAQALTARTEGWPAGLQLAGLSLRNTDDVDRFVEDFAGSHRFVLDYLVEEVLSRQSEPVRRFLLDTAVLDAFNAELCDAVTGRDGSATMLESLERDNVFLIALDDQRHWYRYHHLFADALRARVAAQDAGRLPVLHRCASDWYAARSRPEDAVRHALAGGDPTHAAQLVERTLPDIRRDRRDSLLEEWLLALPDNAIRDSALLSAYRSWTCLLRGDLDGVESWLGDAEAALVANPPTPAPGASAATLEELRTLPATIAIFRASAAQARGDTYAAQKHAQQALDATTPEDHMARGGALGFLGLSAFARGNLEPAIDQFSQALQSLAAAGDISDALGGTVVLGDMWLACGRPDEARRLFERALDTASRHTGAALATLGDLHVGLAAVLVEQGDLDAAAGHLVTAESLGDSASLPENRFRWFLASSQLRRARGEGELADEHLARAKELYVPGFFPDVHHLADATTATGTTTAAGAGVAAGERTAYGPEALSEREMEVLRLLATALTGPEIARELYVSLNTLRTHTKHIFTKLDVNTRRAAVERARGHGLL